MKLHTRLNCVLLIAGVICSIEAFAYNADKDNELCRNPKVQEFTLPEYQEPDKKEAAPETEFSFVVSGWANPKQIKLFTKDNKIPFSVQSTETFHKVKAKLLPEFTGKTVRINARIPALLGCYTTIGWLIKVSDQPKAVEKQESADDEIKNPNDSITPGGNDPSTKE
jgi:hypothetical protein